MSQLRSGFCSRLKSFQFRIGGAPDDLCPECGSKTHDINHIFNCQTHPTRLTTESLWKDHWAAARLIRTQSSLNFLPDVGDRPPPRQRQRRRPPSEPPPSPDFSPVSLPPPFLFTPPPLTPLLPPPLMNFSFPSVSSISFSASLFSPVRFLLSQALRHAELDGRGSGGGGGEIAYEHRNVCQNVTSSSIIVDVQTTLKKLLWSSSSSSPSLL